MEAARPCRLHPIPCCVEYGRCADRSTQKHPPAVTNRHVAAPPRADPRGIGGFQSSRRGNRRRRHVAALRKKRHVHLSPRRQPPAFFAPRLAATHLPSAGGPVSPRPVENFHLISRMPRPAYMQIGDWRGLFPPRDRSLYLYRSTAAFMPEVKVIFLMFNSSFIREWKTSIRFSQVATFLTTTRRHSG